MAWTFLRRGTRTRGATAALLSSVVPGLGQLYNRDWPKATMMGATAAGLVLLIKDVLARLLSMSVSATSGGGSGGDPTLRLLAAMALPDVQAEIRHVLLPALLALCALLTWSMVDAYRRARRES